MSYPHTLLCYCTRCLTRAPHASWIVYFSYPGFIYIDYAFVLRQKLNHNQSILLSEYKTAFWIWLYRYLFNHTVTQSYFFPQDFTYTWELDLYIRFFLSIILNYLCFHNWFVLLKHFLSYTLNCIIDLFLFLDLFFKLLQYIWILLYS